MATSSTSRRSEDDRKAVSTHYHERNRTFSSTTTNHYKNKLAQIGIQKDLREIIDRKRLEKEQEKSNPLSSGDSTNETSCQSRKVRFSEEKVPIRRSKSFTAGTNKNFNQNVQDGNVSFKEKSPPKKFNKNLKGKRKDHIDLQNPTNIKIELQTDSGERKCTLDENVPLTAVKCDLKNCRNILNHSEVKTLMKDHPNDKKPERSHSFTRGSNRSRSFNKKNNIRNEQYTPQGEFHNIPPAQMIRKEAEN